MTSITLYRETSQGQYEPVIVEEWDTSDIWPVGSHIITVRPNGRNIRYRVNPDHATTLATVATVRDELAGKVAEIMSLRPSANAVTPEQKEAWDHMKRAFGPSVCGVQPSAYEIVDSLTEALAGHVQELVDNHPKVMDALERYKMLVKLAVSQDEES